MNDNLLLLVLGIALITIFALNTLAIPLCPISKSKSKKRVKFAPTESFADTAALLNAEAGSVTVLSMANAFHESPSAVVHATSISPTDPTDV